MSTSQFKPESTLGPSNDPTPAGAGSPSSSIASGGDPSSADDQLDLKSYQAFAHPSTARNPRLEAAQLHRAAISGDIKQRYRNLRRNNLHLAPEHRDLVNELLFLSRCNPASKSIYLGARYGLPPRCHVFISEMLEDSQLQLQQLLSIIDNMQRYFYMGARQDNVPTRDIAPVDFNSKKKLLAEASLRLPLHVHPLTRFAAQEPIKREHWKPHLGSELFYSPGLGFDHGIKPYGETKPEDLADPKLGFNRVLNILDYLYTQRFGNHAAPPIQELPIRQLYKTSWMQSSAYLDRVEKKEQTDADLRGRRLTQKTISRAFGELSPAPEVYRSYSLQELLNKDKDAYYDLLARYSVVLEKLSVFFYFEGLRSSFKVFAKASGREARYRVVNWLPLYHYAEHLREPSVYTSVKGETVELPSKPSLIKPHHWAALAACHPYYVPPIILQQNPFVRLHATRDELKDLCSIFEVPLKDLRFKIKETRVFDKKANRIIRTKERVPVAKKQAALGSFKSHEHDNIPDKPASWYAEVQEFMRRTFNPDLTRKTDEPEPFKIPYALMSPVVRRRGQKVTNYDIELEAHYLEFCRDPHAQKYLGTYREAPEEFRNWLSDAFAPNKPEPRPYPLSELLGLPPASQDRLLGAYLGSRAATQAPVAAVKLYWDELIEAKRRGLEEVITKHFESPEVMQMIYMADIGHSPDDLTKFLAWLGTKRLTFEQFAEMPMEAHGPLLDAYAARQG